jgi:hypothetical protein
VGGWMGGWVGGWVGVARATESSCGVLLLSLQQNLPLFIYVLIFLFMYFCTYLLIYLFISHRIKLRRGWSLVQVQASGRWGLVRVDEGVC